ncbi:alpha/beta hydrolase [Nocardioides sp. URHA0020]|uniref:alpha/beta hydrolase n=1 Tax=Nocardioides sp. URHA0020 TaxID=1380392 RepID=UPI00048DCB3C|nr:alpha/beta hydrolase-fold protein [Nocardioides sp. URHA0020]
MVSRRTFLLGGAAVTGVVAAGAVGVEQGVLPGRPTIQSRLGLNGAAGTPPDVAPARVERGSFASAHRPGVDTRWVILRPPGAPRDLPVVVALHGLHQSAETIVGASLYVDRYLAAAVADGVPPFAVAAVDGGTSYWHPRPDGEDTGAMVVDELLPLLEQQGLDVSRVGLLGWSMGGYGALRLGGLLGPDRVGAVVASSPAIWLDDDSASRSGFADAAEYAQFTVVGHQQDLAGVPVRVDVGTGDPFYRDVQDYVHGFPHDADVVSTFRPGAHDPAYWRRMLPAQLRFLGRGVGSGA